MCCSFIHSIYSNGNPWEFYMQNCADNVQQRQLCKYFPIKQKVGRMPEQVEHTQKIE